MLQRRRKLAATTARTTGRRDERLDQRRPPILCYTWTWSTTPAPTRAERPGSTLARRWPDGSDDRARLERQAYDEARATPSCADHRDSNERAHGDRFQRRSWISGHSQRLHGVRELDDHLSEVGGTPTAPTSLPTAGLARAARHRSRSPTGPITRRDAGEARVRLDRAPADQRLRRRHRRRAGHLEPAELEAPAARACGSPGRTSRRPGSTRTGPCSRRTRSATRSTSSPASPTPTGRTAPGRSRRAAPSSAPTGTSAGASGPSGRSQQSNPDLCPGTVAYVANREADEGRNPVRVDLVRAAAPERPARARAVAR